MAHFNLPRSRSMSVLGVMPTALPGHVLQDRMATQGRGHGTQIGQCRSEFRNFGVNLPRYLMPGKIQPVVSKSMVRPLLLDIQQ